MLMESNGTPPILEVEDRPSSWNSSSSARTSFCSDRSLHSVALHKDFLTPIISRKLSENAPRQQAEPPLSTIDDHDLFWATYDKAAGAFDQELLDGWNKSLDILLIFAGLFSAVNTAFIVESYKGLQPDPTETANMLLRLLLIHRNDDVAFSTEDLNSSAPLPSAISVNSIFFSSLSFSLTAAFGAVTAKQWLNEYSNAGSIKALHAQGRERQAKFKGLKSWHFRFIMESLPMLLQFSLFLFFMGVVRFLWDLQRSVAIVQLVLSVAGLAIYVATIVIGVMDPTSPFQTPLTKHLPQYLRKLHQHLEGGFSRSQSRYKFAFAQLAGRSIQDLYRLPGVNSFAAAFNQCRLWLKWCWWDSRGVLRIGHSLAVLFGRTATIAEAEITAQEVTEWDRKDVLAGESVVWLLEQAENPDMTIIALDAIRRLPADLMLFLIERREGLLERLVIFHNGLLPASLLRDLRWAKTWEDEVVVSGLALLHILKARPQKRPRSSIDPAVRVLRNFGEVDDVEGRWGDPAFAARGFLALALSTVSEGYSGPLVTLASGLQAAKNSLSHSTQLRINLGMLKQPSMGIFLHASVSSFCLALDSIICFSLRNFDGPDYLHHPNSLLTRVLDVMYSALREKLSHDLVSHIALTIATIQWLNWPNDSRAWSYPLNGGRDQFKKLLLSRLRAVDKSKMVLENVALTLSLVGVVDFDPINAIHHALLAATEDLFHDSLKFAAATYPNLPQSLLRLSRKSSSDSETHARVLRLLSWAHRWISPLIGEYKDDIRFVLQCTRSPSFIKDYGNQMAFKTLLSRLVLHADNGLFTHIFFSDEGLFHGVPGMDWRPEEQQTFVTRTLQLQLSGLEYSSMLYGAQMVLSTRRLSHMADRLIRFNHIEDLLIPALQGFLDRSVTTDSDFTWPGYFQSAGVALRDQLHVVPNVKRIQTASHHSEFHVVHLWIGESIMLLWRKFGRELQCDRLPSGWSDSTFFEAKVVDAMLEYFKHVSEQQYTGYDRNTLRKYLRRAQESQYCFSNRSGVSGSPEYLTNGRKLNDTGDVVVHKVQRLLAGEE
ncbi:hypothetical protein FRC03_004701, partial [Tulasnella sp. 419]